MKSRNIKTRLVAFGLALLMGISPLGNLADVHAAETKNPSEPVTESAEISETEQTEEVSEAAKHLVTAEDITKDISDKDFMAETCMEGIHYNSEQEDVTLERIEAEDGGSYHPDQAGTYIATYWVVPKDARDSYSVSRKIILTDTEGQAHTEENGGQKQKEDTNSEEDSETPVQEIPDVEVTVSGEDADAQAARELEEKIEDGEVMMLSGAENTFRAKETVHLEKGETIYYPSYIGNYLTCWFTVNGKIAYCLESHRSSPPSGDYVAQVLDSNKNLQKVLYYGYGGAGDITGSYLSGKSAEEKYVYQFPNSDVVEISLATMCSADRENITTVKALLDEIENEALFNLLRSADKETLQIVFFRMLDIPTEQIAEKMGLTPNAIYLRINRLKEKIKKLKMGERK